MKLEGKVIWITGASSGIGEALAYTCAAAGATLVLSARNEQELQRVAAAAKTGKILVLPLDLEDTANVGEKVAQVIAEFGKIDILVNNAGIGHRTRILHTPPVVDRKVMEVNFFGTVNLTKEVAREMQKAKSGKIVVITSVMGKHGWPLYSTYCASKHALYGYFEALRQELYFDNVKVLIVCPGYIKTDIGEKMLNEKGEMRGVKNKGQYGMDVAVCAAEIADAIESRKEHVFIGGKREIRHTFLKYFFPKRFYKMVRKYPMVP